MNDLAVKVETLEKGDHFTFKGATYVHKGLGYGYCCVVNHHINHIQAVSLVDGNRYHFKLDEKVIEKV